MKKAVVFFCVLMMSVMLVLSVSAATTTSFYLGPDTDPAPLTAGAFNVQLVSGSHYGYDIDVASSQTVGTNDINIMFDISKLSPNPFENLNPNNTNRLSISFGFGAAVENTLNTNSFEVSFNFWGDGSDKYGTFKPVEVYKVNGAWVCVFDIVLPRKLIEAGFEDLEFYFAFKTPIKHVHLITYEYTITSSSGADEIIEEDYGYSKPSTPEQDAGLDAGNNLLDQMTAGIDEFNATVGQNTQVLIDNLNRIKVFIDGSFNAIPMPITLTISGVVVFLVVRKVVGR